METLYWHDYETFGRSPAKDRLAQFAGIRTDTELNIIGKPLVKYCKLTKDAIPEPGACLVTGIVPQLVNQKGVTEAQFMAAVMEELAAADTCSVGFNTSNFDDEFTRYALYRNFYNPYDHHDERRGYSRWDLINVVRLIRAFNPECEIIWPKKEDGKYSTRLEDLTKANGISHDAHDALADVYATLELAKLLKKHFPKMYAFCFQHRTKTNASELLGIEKKRLVAPKPLIHVDSFYGSDNNYVAVIYPVAMHPNKGNSIIGYNVLHDPAPLLELTARELAKKLFTKKENPDDQRIGMHEINANKCPVLMPLDKISKASCAQLGIDKNVCFEHIKQINSKCDVPFVAQVAYHKTFEERTDPELMLYDGFFDKKDKDRIWQVRTTSAKALKTIDFGFEDSRLPELLFRYRARNHFNTLTAEEKKRWDEYCTNRWHNEELTSLTLEQFYEKLDELDKDEKLPEDKKKIVQQLREYGKATFV